MSSALGLGLFGALKILIAASMFVANGSSEEDWIAMAVMVPGAAVLGWFAG